MLLSRVTHSKCVQPCRYNRRARTSAPLRLWISVLRQTGLSPADVQTSVSVRSDVTECVCVVCQGEASPLHLLADRTRRNRQHPVAAQEEVSHQELRYTERVDPAGEQWTVIY